VESSTALAKDFIRNFGLDKETMEVIKTAGEMSLAILKESPTIYTFVKRFQSTCSEEFLKMNLTNFLTAMTIDKFPWKSSQIKHKTMLAGMLCDVMLVKEDFEVIKRHEEGKGELSEKLKKHPFEISEILRRKMDLIPMETITIIEQHHERPDGSGYPHGITISRFNQLSAIFIVCQKFVDALFESNFDFNKRLDIIKSLQEVYNSGPFEKALDALVFINSSPFKKSLINSF
jgi:response regulator RpfG family c-di-GMP phosphodiesterase